MNQAPENEGAAVIPLARRSHTDHDDPTVRPSGSAKNARRPRRKAGACEVRLSDSGLFAGFLYEYEPERSDLSGASPEREPLPGVAPYGAVSPLTVVPDEGIYAGPGSDIPGFVSDDRHRS